MMKKILLILPIIIFISCPNAMAGFCLEGNCLNGRGVYQWNNGSTFTGWFKEGVPDGEGHFITSDKRKYNAVYKDGKPVEISPYSEEEELIKQRHLEAEKFNMAGLEYYNQKKYESAIFFFNKAITLWPDNAEFYMNYRKAKDRR